ncbi:hypothetical protein ES703_55217 [subsurface metagenome]
MRIVLYFACGADSEGKGFAGESFDDIFSLSFAWASFDFYRFAGCLDSSKAIGVYFNGRIVNDHFHCLGGFYNLIFTRFEFAFCRVPIEVDIPVRGKLVSEGPALLEIHG